GRRQTREPQQSEERHRYRGLVTAENRVDLSPVKRRSEAGPAPDAQDDIPIGGIGRVQIQIDRRLGRASLVDRAEERVVRCRGARSRKGAAVESEVPGSRESGGVERSLNLVIDGAEMGEVERQPTEDDHEGYHQNSREEQNAALLVPEPAS